MTSEIMESIKDKRQSLRKSCVYMPVDFVLDDRLQRGLIMNISETGACVENTSGIQTGAFATMTFLENHEFGPVKTTARVVRAFESGFAVCFDGLTPKQHNAISSFVHME